jgi:hypothetical protein
MRVYSLAGIALIVVGALFFYRGGSFTSRRDVLSVGGVTVSAEEQHPIRPWVVGLAVLGGIALVVTGARRKA